MTAVSESIAAFNCFQEMMSGETRLSEDVREATSRLAWLLKGTHAMSEDEFADFLRAFRIQMRKLKVLPLYTYKEVGMREEIPMLPLPDERVLRKSVIRLAHGNPKLRPHLLPLVRIAGMGKPTAVDFVELLTELAKGKFHKATTDKHALELLVGSLRRVSAMSEMDLKDFVSTYRQLTSRKPIRP